MSPARRIATRLAGACLAVLLVAASGRAAGRCDVSVHDGLLSAEITDAPIEKVFAELGAKAGVKFRMLTPLKPHTVTISLKDRPIERAVAEILRHGALESHAIVYDADSALTFVVTETGGGAPPAAAAAEPAEAPPAGEVPAVAATNATPVYIPPAKPPVYIPPSRPPVYIPPSSPPVYIPPAEPPREVPDLSSPATAP